MAVGMPGVLFVLGSAQVLENSVREKVSRISNKVEQAKQFCWDQLTPAAQAHLQLIWTRDASRLVGLQVPYKKNLLEEIGDWMLFPTIDLPKKLLPYGNNRIVIAFASIAGLFLGIKWILHPITTTVNFVTSRPVSFLTKMSLLGLFCRSVGRYTNSVLMTRFHQFAQQAADRS